MSRLYLNEADAYRFHKIDAETLAQLVEQGVVDVVRIQDLDGSIHTVYYDDDLAAYAAERDISPEQFTHLRGNLLGMSEAAIKYGVNPTVISAWVKRDLLEVKGTGPRNKKLVDEAEVAYLITLGKAKRMRPGRSPF